MRRLCQRFNASLTITTVSTVTPLMMWTIDRGISLTCRIPERVVEEAEQQRREHDADGLFRPSRATAIPSNP